MYMVWCGYVRCCGVIMWYGEIATSTDKMVFVVRACLSSQVLHTRLWPTNLMNHAWLCWSVHATLSLCMCVWPC